MSQVTHPDTSDAHDRSLRATGPLGIAATFIGTTIGAGYASGQEILQYFVSFGLVRGTAALLIAGTLFFALSAIVLRLAQRMRSAAIHDIVNPTGRRWPTWFADVTITASLLGTLVIMLAGAGTALNTALGLPGVVGALLMAAACVMSVLTGISGLMKVQSVVVPAIVVVAVGVAAWGLLHPGPSTGGDVAALVNSSPMINQWWISGVLYVAFNFQLAYAVFAPMGATATASPRTLVAGAIMFALTAHATLIGRTDLPMVELAAGMAGWIAVVYTVVLLLAQFTTALSCLFGSVERLRHVPGLRRLPFWVVAVLTAVVTTALSGIGFSDLIGTVYPVLGYAGLVIIALLLASWLSARRRARRTART